MSPDSVGDGREERIRLGLLVVFPRVLPARELHEHQVLLGIDEHELAVNALGSEAMMRSRKAPPLISVSQRRVGQQLAELDVRVGRTSRLFHPTGRQQLAAMPSTEVSC
jgi:hypothetical protein